MCFEVNNITSKHDCIVWMVCATRACERLFMRRNSQATEGVGWMPRGQGPTKDAARGETWAGSCSRAMIRPNPNGATRKRASACTGG